MHKFFHRLSWAVFAVIVLIVAAFLQYTLPRQSVVRVVNAEIQRIEGAGNSWFYASSEPGDVNGTRDVKMIQTITPNGKPRVFRNEDTGWGWPPYFKFDSSDLQAKASDMVSNGDNPKWVLVRSYGWRSTLMSIYPNVTSLRVVSGPDAKPFPWGNVIFIVLFLAVIGVIARLILRFWENRIDPILENIGDVFDHDEDAAPAGGGGEKRRGWFRR